MTHCNVDAGFEIILRYIAQNLLNFSLGDSSPNRMKMVYEVLALIMI